MSKVFYTDDHEYIKVEDGVGVVGITEYAQQQLGDVVYVELPESGRALSQKDESGVVESVKVASELYAPVSGEIVEVNEALNDNPALVNQDATGEGWFFKIKISDESELDGLKDEGAYKEYLTSLS